MTLHILFHVYANKIFLILTNCSPVFSEIIARLANLSIIIIQVLHRRLLKTSHHKGECSCINVQLKSSFFSSFLNIKNDKGGSLSTGCRLFQAVSGNIRYFLQINKISLKEINVISELAEYDTRSGERSALHQWLMAYLDRRGLKHPSQIASQDYDIFKEFTMARKRGPSCIHSCMGNSQHATVQMSQHVPLVTQIF